MNDAHNVIAELQARTSSHPNLASIWLFAIENSLRRIEAEIANARVALEGMRFNQDVELEQLVALCSVFGR
jgi:hypothetical protein